MQNQLFGVSLLRKIVKNLTPGNWLNRESLSGAYATAEGKGARPQCLDLAAHPHTAIARPVPTGQRFGKLSDFQKRQREFPLKSKGHQLHGTAARPTPCAPRPFLIYLNFIRDRFEK